jgi:hypothetical protein
MASEDDYARQMIPAQRLGEFADPEAENAREGLLLAAEMVRQCKAVCRRMS